MSAANKLVPELRFPEFQKDKEWLSSSLRQLGEIVTGKTPSTKDLNLWNGEIPFITPTDISENSKYQYTTQRSVAKTKNTKTVPPGSIVYTCIASIGKMAVTSCESLTNQQINSVIVRKQHSSDFVYYSLLHQTPRIKNTPASSPLPIINKTEFSKLLIPKPDLPEQQKIADCLGSLDDLIAAHRRKLDALQDHKKGLLQNLFPAEKDSGSEKGEVRSEKTPKLRFPEFEGRWEEIRLRKCVKLISGLHLAPEGYGSTGSLPYFTGPSDFTDSIQSVTKWTDRPGNEGNAGDTLITVKGSGSGTIWRLKLNKVALGRQLMAIRPAKIGGKFLFYFLATKQQFFEDLSLGNLIPGFSRDGILDTRLLLPEPPEQQKIADCLSALDALITAQTEQIAALKAHKKGLMQQLFPNPGGK